MLDVYDTFPMARTDIDDTFHGSITKATAWSESAGLTGLLIFTDNDTIDPWSGAQFLLERTQSLTPLVAVQPLYMHEVVEQFHSAHASNFDAPWHHDTFTPSGQEIRPAAAYWLYPFRVSREYCPCVVGSHAEVAEMLAHCLRSDVRTLILAAPRIEGDLVHAMEAVRRAERIAWQEEEAA